MISIQKGTPLKDFSNYKIGGRAKYFLEVNNLPELKEGLVRWKKISKTLPTLPAGRQVFVLGGGTNVLVSDKGFGGLVIHNKIKNIERQGVRESNLPVGRQGVRVRVGSGLLMEDLLNFCVQNCLSGLEWGGGLPGTVGGAIRGNAGAFKGEIKDNIVEVTSLDIKTLKIKKRNLKDCKFEYRSSVFKSQSEKESENQEIIIETVLSLKKGNKKDIENKIKEKIKYRRQRHPLEFPNIGSIFKNILIEKVPQKLLEQLEGSIKNDPFPILPTAKLLALAGLKGKRVGGAMVSHKHPNFIVNFDNASSADIQKLIREIKKIIKDKYGITLEEEITYLD